MLQVIYLLTQATWSPGKHFESDVVPLGARALDVESIDEGGRMRHICAVLAMSVALILKVIIVIVHTFIAPASLKRISCSAAASTAANRFDVMSQLQDASCVSL